MDYNPTTPPQPPSYSDALIWSFSEQTQLYTLLGKAVETLLVNHARQTIEESYSQTLKALENVDSSLDRVGKSVDDSLSFPFDVMEYASRTVSDNWRILTGQDTAAEHTLAQQIENQSQQFSLKEKQLKADISVLTKSISAKDEQVLELQAVSEKARKAKQSVQRTQRKLKAELEAYNEKAIELKAVAITTREKYDQQLSENAVLQTQKQQIELELVEAKQENQKLIAGSEQMATNLEALSAEQEKLIAEKDGLHKRIEELQHLLEQASHYTE